MRKFLIIILIVVLLAILGFMSIQGLSIGNFKIHSVEDIIADDKRLDEELATLSYSIDNNYETVKTTLQQTLQNLLQSKKAYEDAITFSTEDEIQKANQSEKYKLDYLWTKIGLYATENNIVLQMQVLNSSSGISSQYDISFSVTGEYISISEFIYAIENDSSLGFKIESFKLEDYPGTKTDENGNVISDNLLQGSFIVRNVPLDQDSIITTQSSSASTSTSTNAGTGTGTSTQTKSAETSDQTQNSSAQTNPNQTQSRT